MARKPSARQLLQHALDIQDMSLAALIIATGALDFLDQLPAEQPAAERAKELTTLVLNAVPVRA